MPASKPKIIKPCAICGVIVSRCPSQVKGRKLYCSKECVGKAKHNGSILKCALCGGSFYRRFGEQDRGVRVRQFCSNGCRDRFRALNRKDSTYPKRGTFHVHRLVAERVLGRSLLPNEVVHHQDENKHNNEPRNLVVFPTQADHCRWHKGAMTKDELRRHALVPSSIK